MEKETKILVIGVIGLLMYSLSTADWDKIANILERFGLLLFGGTILYTISKLK